mmetsp:Transcript_12120/g.15977  ORF Transcript_12120/g.15977 Transcript_12120/m.15977 type:complete len:203 (-) Transcript_12120:425-1033(-)
MRSALLMIVFATITSSLSLPWRLKQESRSKDLTHADDVDEDQCEAPSMQKYAHTTRKPSFTGDWSLARVENQDSFLKVLGYSNLIRQVAKTPLGMRVFQSITHDKTEDRLLVTIKTPIGSRSASVVVGRIPAGGTITQDDVGEKMRVESVTWKGSVLVCEARYVKKGIPVRIERYLDGAFMVEFVTNTESGITMKRIFKKSS